MKIRISKLNKEYAHKYYIQTRKYYLVSSSES